METALIHALASVSLRAILTPAFIHAAHEIKNIRDIDEALHKLEICRDEALGLLYKADPNEQWYWKKLAKCCLKAEDLIDTLQHEIIRLELPAFTSKTFSLISPKILDKPHEIVKLEKKMRKLIGRMKVDSSQEIQPPLNVNFRERSILFGRDVDIDTIVQKLSCQEKDGLGVSIVGMRGVGKTALADYILQDEKVRDEFPLILRASMSGKTLSDLGSILVVIYDRNNLSKNNCVSESVMFDLKKSSTQWLIMLDDLAEIPSTTWHYFCTTYLSSNRGKLLITTLSPRVGNLAGTIVHHLKPLSQSHCKDLINYELSNLPRKPPCFTTQHSLVSELANKSCGLPLVATFLVHSLLALEEGSRYLHESPLRWPRFEEEILPILKSGPASLDIRYKRCFVYFSLFPHDDSFLREDLVLLWMGERLVLPEASMFNYNGYNVFDELLGKSIIQPCLDGRRYEMHKFTHHVAQLLGSKLFVHMDNECASTSYEWDKCTHHLSLSCTMQDKLWDQIAKHLRHLRTLLLMRSPKDRQIGKIPINFFKKLSKLRVLSLSNTDIVDLPKSIKELKCLRYLDITETGIKIISKTLTKLSTLQILKLKNGHDIPKLPLDLYRLTSLAFVDWNKRHKQVSDLPNIGKLVNLRTLPLFIVGKNDGYHITELKDMNHVEGSITITNLQNTSVKEAKEAMLSLKLSLKRLEFVWTGDCENANGVLAGLKPHDQLLELSIENYCGNSFPH